MHGKLYLNVPYAEKEAAKQLGARWDPAMKKWFFQGPVREYVKFARWITEGREITTIAHEYVFIVEGVQTCFRCGKTTRVVGLGIGEHTRLYDNEDGTFDSETVEDLMGYEPLFLAWVDREEDIPPALLRYLKEHYCVKTGFSRTAGKCFANHCEHCGVIQGNWHLFEEDSPLTLYIPDGPELREKLRKLKIYSIGIDENLVLDWNFGYGDNDGLYLKYAKMEELILPPSEDEYISYQDMYSGG